MTAAALMAWRGPVIAGDAVRVLLPAMFAAVELPG